MTRKAVWLRSNICFFLALLALILLMLGAAPVRAQTLGPDYVPGEILIGWQPGEGSIPEVQRIAGMLELDQNDPVRQTAVREINRLTGLSVLGAAPEYGIARLAVNPGAEAAEITRLEALPWVRYAEPNHYAYAAGETLYPSDPDYPRQWNMERVAAPEAWAATLGSPSLIVAVLDTGVAQGHPEFAGKLLPGWDYVNMDSSPEDDDSQGHGTHVTGIIAAGFDNGIGVAGLAPDVKILPLKVLDSQRLGTYSAIAQAIYFAANSRAQIINLSLAGFASSEILRTAVADVTAQGVLVVAAAGNCAQNLTSCGGMINPDMYPAAYPGVLAVSSSDRLDRATTYSGYKAYIGLAAPGGTAADAVWSTTRSGYGYMYGTSMSTPMVSAAAALVWTLKPAAAPQEVAATIKSTADKVGTDPYSGEPLSYSTGRNDYFGSGRLNVGQAVRWAFPPSVTTAAGLQTIFLGEPLTTQSRAIEIANPSNQGVWWQATVLDGTGWLSVSPASGTAMYSAPGLLTLKAELGALTPNTYVGIIRVQPLYPQGLASFDIAVQLRVVASVTQLHLPLACAAR